MGASVSLQGRFCHEMDPDSSILVSPLGYTEFDQSIEFQRGSFVHSDGLLISVSLQQRSFWFDMDFTLFVSVTFSGFTDTD